MKIKSILFLSLIGIYFLLIACNNLNKEKEIVSISDKTQILESIEQLEIDTINLEVENIQSIIQKSIDLPKFQQYYHIKEDVNRSPLIIMENDKIIPNLELNKFGEKVRVLNKLSIEEQGKAHLVFKKISIHKNTASVNFSYAIEGISVRIEFIKKNNEWLVEESQLMEN